MRETREKENLQPRLTQLHPLRRARPLLRRRGTCAPSVPHETAGSMRASGARSACTSLIFASRSEQPVPPYEPYYVPHGPHEIRRVVLAGREARVDPGEHPHMLEARRAWLAVYTPFKKGC